MFKTQQWIKAFTYRFYSVILTFIISYIFTSNWVIALSIGLIDSLVKIFSYYAFDEIWEHFTKPKIKPGVVFLTGLSGAGKTTLAISVIKQLQKKGLGPVLLDGDEIRNAIKLTGFDEDSRKQHNLNVGYMAKILESQGKIVIVSLIAPYADIRDQVRNMCGRFIEIHVATDIAVCMQRDTKGLYEKALKGELMNFTGISAPYFPPLSPELVIDTALHSVEEGTNMIIKALQT